jgi:hypothetical protein
MRIVVDMLAISGLYRSAFKSTHGMNSFLEGKEAVAKCMPAIKGLNTESEDDWFQDDDAGERGLYDFDCRACV